MAERTLPTASEQMSMNEQLLYKLAGIDAAMQSGFRRIDEKMDRFQTDLHESQISTNDRINSLDKEVHETFLRKRARMDGQDKLIAELKAKHESDYNEIKTWQQVVVAKVGVISTSIALVWVLFAPTIRDFLGISNT